MIRIVLADKHPVVRNGLTRWFQATTTYNVVAEAATSDELVRHVQHTACDVIIGDTLFGKQYDVIPILKKQSPSVAVIVFSRYCEASYIAKAFRLGAMAYLSKMASRDELVRAIQDVVLGKRYVEGQLHADFFDECGDIITSARRSLSPRQSEVLEMIVGGKRSSEIAEHLGVSIKTVSSHRTNLLDKLHLTNAQQIVRHVVEERLLTVPTASWHSGI